MSDAVIQSIVTAVVTIALAWLAGRKLCAIEKKAALTHDLVNSASLIQLKLYAVATRRIATLTGEPADNAVAEEAEQLYLKREAEQVKATVKHGSV